METPSSSDSSDEKSEESIAELTTQHEARRDFVDRLLKTMMEMGQARKEILNSEAKHQEFLLSRERKKKVQKKMKGLKMSDSEDVEEMTEKKMEKIKKKRMEQKVTEILNLTMNSTFYDAQQQLIRENMISINPMIKNFLTQRRLFRLPNLI